MEESKSETISSSLLRPARLWPGKARLALGPTIRGTMLGGVSSVLWGLTEVWPAWGSGCLGVHVGEGQSLGLNAPAKFGQQENTDDLSNRRAGISLTSVCIPRAQVLAQRSEHTVLGWVVSLTTSYVEALTPSLSECDCIWRSGL